MWYSQMLVRSCSERDFSRPFGFGSCKVLCNSWCWCSTWCFVQLLSSKRCEEKKNNKKILCLNTIDPRGRPQTTIFTQSVLSVRKYVRPSVRPITSKSSDNHCKPGLWAGRVDHWWLLSCFLSFFLFPLVSSSSYLFAFCNMQNN